jgi:hypothetical protein
MKSVDVSIDVLDSRNDVYEFLAVTARHESFTNHMLRDWSCSGPDRGVGSKAHVTAVLGGRREPIGIEVIEDVPLQRIVERNQSAGGRRIATGTYSFSDAPAGGTRVRFTYTWQKAPLLERLMGGFVRSIMRRGLNVAMQRLAEQLEQQRSRLEKQLRIEKETIVN